MTPTPETLREELMKALALDGLCLSSEADAVIRAAADAWEAETDRLQGEITLLVEAESAENSSLRTRLEEADNAMRQALSDLEWIERMVPGSNLQAGILLLRHALAHDKGKDAEGK